MEKKNDCGLVKVARPLGFISSARTADKRPISSVLRTALRELSSKRSKFTTTITSTVFRFFSLYPPRRRPLPGKYYVRSALYVFARAFEKTYFSRLHTRKCENTISCCTVIPRYYCARPTAKYPVSFATTRFFFIFFTKGQCIGADGKPCLNTT